MLNVLVICISVARYVQFVKPYLKSQEMRITFDCGFGFPDGCKNANEKYKQLEQKTNTQYIIPILIGLVVASLLVLKLPNNQKK